MPDRDQSLIEMGYIAAGLVTRIEADLHRLKGMLLDMRQVQVDDAITPVLTPAPRRPRLYALGELERCVLMHLGAVDELSLHALLARLQVEKPGTTTGSLSSCLTTLIRSGQVLRVGYGVYRKTDRPPHLSVVEA